MEISRLWAAMLTRNLGAAATDDSITLTISSGGVDLLNHTFPDTTQRDQEAGQANLYEVNVEGRNIVPENGPSFRVGILGSHAWQPVHFMVWGVRTPSFMTPFFGTEVIPLAIETDITTQISTDPSEGPASIPLRPVGRGDRNTQINRLFMLVTTAVVGDIPRGTNGTLEIQIVSEGRLVVLFEIRNTTQDDLEAGEANFYSVPVIVPFTKGGLDDHSITLRLRGVAGDSTPITGLLDDWLPASFFLFGLDDAAGRPESIVPLVHLPEWPHGIMQPDATSATASVTLSLATEPFLAPEGELVATLNSIATGQKKIIELLEKLVAK